MTAKSSSSRSKVKKAAPASAKEAVPRRKLSLALQGGGSHGAFTWGVMHRLMEDGRIFIDGISGASAGAVNGVVFSDGFLKNGRQGAIDALEQFWHELSRHSPFTVCGFGSMGCPVNIDDLPGYMMFDMMSRMLSPYQMNPANYNPLETILTEMVDFEAIRNHPSLRLFVAATNVRTSRAKLFRTKELTVKSLLASSCLPMVSQAVEIEGEAYWDGGYLGNPAIYPLVRECDSTDVMLVMVNPLERPGVPDTAREILNRLTEISFNATLLSELRSFAVVSRMLEDGSLKEGHFRKINFHMIEPPEVMVHYNASSKFNTDWGFLQHLRDLGWQAADDWLAKHFATIGKKSSCNLAERFISHG